MLITINIRSADSVCTQQLCLVVQTVLGCWWLLVSVTVSIAGLLVMVSSELVVLLIVCVGINTGSAQGELTTRFLQKHNILASQQK